MTVDGRWIRIRTVRSRFHLTAPRTVRRPPFRPYPPVRFRFVKAVGLFGKTDLPGAGRILVGIEGIHIGI